MSSVVRTCLEDENETVQKQVRDYFARSLVGKIEDQNYIKETALDFCKKQKLKAAILKSVDLLQSSSFDEIRDIIDNAINLGLDNDFGHNYFKDFESRYELKTRRSISTGWREIDEICKGGLGRGELGVVIAPTGAGKSMALVHLGSQALKQGKDVVHYTLELSEEVVALRYDSCISGVHLKDLFSSKEYVQEYISEQVGGSLIVKEYPTRTATVSAIRNHLERIVKRGGNVDFVIVDYGDLLKSTTNFREKRNELESIYEDLRSVAQEFNCSLWTASQTNRGGLSAEVITMESISEAFSKCFVADFIFSLSRTIKDKNSNTGRIFVAKNRNGPDGLIYPIFMDTSNVKIKVMPKLQESIEELENKSSMQEAKELREKYKKFRQERKK
jgi:replicative DNA helicase